MADRRLSRDGHVHREDACKLVRLDTRDGSSILAYAGLGETSTGTEPAEWMARVLRGRDVALEDAIGFLAEAAHRQLPRHLFPMAGRGKATHAIVAPAFVGDEARTYAIELQVSAVGAIRYRYRRVVAPLPKFLGSRPPRIGLGGSGARFVINDDRAQRHLLQIVRAYDSGRIGATTAAREFAVLSYAVHTAEPAGFVGPRTIVSWLHRRGGVHKAGGGHAFFRGAERDSGTKFIPTIVSGLDLRAIAAVNYRHLERMLDQIRSGETNSKIDQDHLRAELERLPQSPDETLD